MTSPAISGIHLARNRRTKAYQLCRILFPSCSPAPRVLAWSGEWRAPRVVENEAQAGQFTEAIRLRKTTNTISRDEIRFFSPVMLVRCRDSLSVMSIRWRDGRTRFEKKHDEIVSVRPPRKGNERGRERKREGVQAACGSRVGKASLCLATASQAWDDEQPCRDSLMVRYRRAYPCTFSALTSDFATIRLSFVSE